SEDEYINSLIDFHKYFNENIRVDGYLGSIVVKVNFIPWSEGSAYEDWYLMESSKTLDLINDYKVKQLHDKVAKIARNGKRWTI
ncbi:MAG: hypothetical protein QW232_08815, partial [Saccharolobus sp.]